METAATRIRTRTCPGGSFFNDIFGTWILNDHGYIFEEFFLKIALFLLPKQVRGLGPWVSALPRGSMDVSANYIFENSMKN